MQNKSRVVYQSVRQITEKKESRVSAIKDKNGVAITDPARIKDRWKEHFAELYNGKVTANANILEELPSSTSNSNVDITPKLEKEEIEAAIKRMKLGKAPGVDKVTVDEMRAAGNIGIDMLFKLFEHVWEREEIPKDWSRAVIVPIFKKKRQDCLRPLQRHQFTVPRRKSIRFCNPSKNTQKDRRKTDRIASRIQKRS